ncbi:polyprenol phosphomannose-dependent alpha 1,6 mannosyltransferase MptB [Saccharomonospora sp. CUA-673]|uniref:polyprenol phosphomannose-dependent alpha 1,6 mannosyltransferase MptB n=1 Tax=Saccharomonospora sp. CUA-673 TaxID=1904969 RepID=UPI000A91D00A
MVFGRGRGRRADGAQSAEANEGQSSAGSLGASTASTVWVPSRSPAHPGDRQPLTDDERRSVRMVQGFGTVGSLMLAFGSLGAGAAPVLNPVNHLPVLRIFARIPTVSLAVAFIGMMMLIIGWLLLGRFARPSRKRMVGRKEMHRTLLLWIAPLTVIPPVFTRDPYVYLGQSEVLTRGMDPYQHGPEVLGNDDPLVVGVANIWRDTPAPYGPLFLRMGSWITGITGEHVSGGILLFRLATLIGLGVVIWVLPRLADRFGVPPSTALWLGVANPLVLFHIVGGAHNDTIGIGLMLLGIWVGLRRLPYRVRGDSPPPLVKGELFYIVLGASIITVAAAVKVHAIVALGFFGVMIARRWYGGIKDLLKAAALMTAVCAVVMTAVTYGVGLDYGWVNGLSTPTKLWNWIAPTSEIGQLGGVLGIALGLGNHTAGIISVLAIISYLVAGAITVKFLWDSLHWRYRPMIGLGVSLGAVMLLHVAMQPWWLLWAIIPLAASAGTSRFRVVATGMTVVLSLLVPPNGSPFDGRMYTLPQAYFAGGLVVLALLALLWWRAPSVLSPAPIRPTCCIRRPPARSAAPRARPPPPRRGRPCPQRPAVPLPRATASPPAPRAAPTPRPEATPGPRPAPAPTPARRPRARPPPRTPRATATGRSTRRTLDLCECCGRRDHRSGEALRIGHRRRRARPEDVAGRDPRAAGPQRCR